MVRNPHVLHVQACVDASNAAHTHRRASVMPRAYRDRVCSAICCNRDAASRTDARQEFRLRRPLSSQAARRTRASATLPHAARNSCVLSAPGANTLRALTTSCSGLLRAQATCHVDEAPGDCAVERVRRTGGAQTHAAAPRAARARPREQPARTFRSASCVHTGSPTACECTNQCEPQFTERGLSTSAARSGWFSTPPASARPRTEPLCPRHRCRPAR